MVNPLILWWGTLSFVSALFIHIAVWRIFRPPREMAWLVVIFLLLPLLVYFAVFSLCFSSPGRYLLSSPRNLFFILLWHGALSSVYIMTYPPIQAGCPSLKIMLAAHKAGPPGLSREEINRLFPESTLISDRFDDLVEDGLISWKYDTWGITATGKLLARFFLFYRRLLKLPLGEG